MTPAQGSRATRCACITAAKGKEGATRALVGGAFPRRRLTPAAPVRIPPRQEQCLSEKGWARAYNLKSIFGANPEPGYRTPDAIFSANYANPLSCQDRHGWYRTQQTVAPVAEALDITVNSAYGFFPDLCGKQWLPAALALFLDYNKQLFNKTPKGFPQWALTVVNQWGQNQPVLNSTDYAGDGVCCPYGNAQAATPISWGDIVLDGFRFANGTVLGPYLGCPASCCNDEAGAAMRDALMQDGVDTILVAWEHANIGSLVKALGVPDAAYDQTEWKDTDYDTIVAISFDGNGTFVHLDQSKKQRFETDETGDGPINFLVRPPLRDAPASQSALTRAHDAAATTDASAPARKSGPDLVLRRDQGDCLPGPSAGNLRGRAERKLIPRGPRSHGPACCCVALASHCALVVARVRLGVLAFYKAHDSRHCFSPSRESHARAPVRSRSRLGADRYPSHRGQRARVRRREGARGSERESESRRSDTTFHKLFLIDEYFPF